MQFHFWPGFEQLFMGSQSWKVQYQNHARKVCHTNVQASHVETIHQPLPEARGTTWGWNEWHFCWHCLELPECGCRIVLAVLDELCARRHWVMSCHVPLTTNK